PARSRAARLRPCVRLSQAATARATAERPLPPVRDRETEGALSLALDYRTAAGAAHELTHGDVGVTEEVSGEEARGAEAESNGLQATARIEPRVAGLHGLPFADSVDRLQMLVVSESHRRPGKHDEPARAAGEQRVEAEVALEPCCAARYLANVGPQQDGQAFRQDVGA